MKMNNIKPTPNQELFVRSMIENHVTICSGPAGSGKTLFALMTAMSQMDQDRIEKVLIVRSIVSAGKDLGALPGTLEERTAPYFMFVEDYLKDICDKTYEKLVKKDKISMMPIEILRGHTYDNTFMILEEAQNATPQQIKMFISRMGKRSRVVIIGDKSQKDTYTDNGLAFCVDHLSETSGCNVVSLGYEDIKRSSVIRDIIEVFDNHAV